MADTGCATRVWALDGATFTVDTSMVMVGGTGTITIPAPSYLIEHPRGLILFDTGINPRAASDPESVYGEMAAHLGLQFTEDQRVDRQIEALGYRTDQISDVVLSHTHFDHTGGVELFGESRLHCGAADLPYAFWPLMPAGAAFFRRQDLEPTRDFNWNPVIGDVDLYGDGSIVMLSMPGHTPGNYSLLVRLPNRRLLLSGDTVHLRAALDARLPMPSDYNSLDAVRSIDRLRRIAMGDDVDVWIAHDSGDWAQFGHAPKWVD